MTSRTPAAELQCPVCRQQAAWMELRCASCGAVLRDRVPTLQLFSTIWQLLVDTRVAMMRISRSEQKNYVYLLFAAEGVVPATLALVTARASDTGMEYGVIALLQWGGGFLAGLFIGPMLSMAAALLLGRARSTYRLWSALLSYGMLPLALASVIVLPLQMAIFGPNMFSMNPWPGSYDPTSFWVLTLLLAVAVLLAHAWWWSALSLHVASGARRFAGLLLVPAIHAGVVVLLAALLT